MIPELNSDHTWARFFFKGGRSEILNLRGEDYFLIFLRREERVERERHYLMGLEPN